MQLPTITNKTITATPVEAVHCQLLPAILKIAQTAIIGALIIACNPITTSV